MTGSVTLEFVVEWRSGAGVRKVLKRCVARSFFFLGLRGIEAGLCVFKSGARRRSSKPAGYPGSLEILDPYWRFYLAPAGRFFSR